MDTRCWQILGIPPTQDQDVIRQAYRQKVPQFHPETDPQGFKLLRQAYDTACKLAQTPPTENNDKDEADIPEADSELTSLQDAFDQLLSNAAERCDPPYWQRYIHLLNQHSVDVIDRLRWPMLQRLYQEPGLSNRCARILADRLRWQQRLNDLDAGLPKEIQDFLDSLEHDDLFDFSVLSHLSLPAQLQTIAYFQQANELFWSRPPFMLKSLLSDAAALYWPDAPDIMRRLARWHSYAEQPNAQLRDYCLQQMAETPEDDDCLYLAARHCSLCDDRQQALTLWLRLYQRNGHPHAEQWLLSWCARDRSDLLPLLIQSLNPTPAPDLAGLPADAPQQRFFIAPQNTQMMTRWGQALRLSPAPQAQDYILWKLGRQDVLPIYRRLLQNDGADIAQTLYWHACMLTLGDERLLQDILDQPPPEDPLHALILRGLQTQAAQRLSWLESSAIIQSFTQWLADPASPLPEAFAREDAAGWQQAQAWLRQFRALPPDSLRKLYNGALPRQTTEPIKDCLADLLPAVALDLAGAGANIGARDALRQAILLIVILNDPLDDIIIAAKPTLPRPAPTHPVYSLVKLFDGMGKPQEEAAAALKQRLTLSDPLHRHCWLQLPLSPEEYIDNQEDTPFTSASDCYDKNRHWPAIVAQSPVIYQLLFHALYASLGEGESAERHRSRLERLEVKTEPEEQIRNALLEGPSHAFSARLKRLSNDQKAAQIADILRHLYERNDVLPTDLSLTFLLERVNDPHEEITLRLIAKILLQLTEQRENRLRDTSVKTRSLWRCWRLDDRISRREYLLQAGLGSMLISSVSDFLLFTDVFYYYLIPWSLILCNIFIATRRRFNDMGFISPKTATIVTFILPILFAIPLIAPGTRRWNKFGPPRSKARD
ncbi:molecular chaperone DnaJ [Brenneria populi]|uniref:Molecular chaperone DnaJ n=1 Tax=Brenneria populi TaxID=1505588 RepID=A0ABU6JSQ2_9GAMM|nr:molecular chaperone DnaJ [Brenneria populi Li et al. 2015]